MAHLAILVAGHAAGATGLVISGEARVSGMEANAAGIGWSVEVAYDALAATINAACQEAAIAAVESETEFTVGALDTKTVYAGAASL